jgi:hypothetical protein
MADRPNRRSRRIKKPLPEIEAATEAIRQRGLVSTQDLFRTIMTIGSLSQGEREVLLLAANKAIGGTIETLGFKTLLLLHERRRKNAETARTGKSEKVVRWHSKAKELANALWRNNPNRLGHTSGSAEEIHYELAAFCEEIKVSSPRPGTVAKYLSSLEGSKG